MVSIIIVCLAVPALGIVTVYSFSNTSYLGEVMTQTIIERAILK